MEAYAEEEKRILTKLEETENEKKTAFEVKKNATAQSRQKNQNFNIKHKNHINKVNVKSLA